MIVISREVRDLIRKICRQNLFWGAPRIHGELLKLGINIAESSVSKYMIRRNKPPSQAWRTFLDRPSRLAAPHLPSPEEAKAGAMPSYDGFRFDDGPRCAPVAPEVGETDPQETVAGGYFWTFCGGPLKHASLVAQS
jgi:hypothetical protein